jgi:hypothetical protein
MDEDRESLARLYERIEHVLIRLERLEVSLGKLAEEMRKMQLERAHERGYWAGAAALAALVGGIISKFL